MQFVVLLCVWFLTGCAAPQNGGIFAGPYPTDNEYSPSRRDLLVAGLLVDSVSWGERGRLRDAETQLRKAYWLSPDSSATRFNLAVVLAQQGQREEARSLLMALMESNGQRPDYLVVLADIQRQEGDYHSAGTSLKAAFLQYARVGNKGQAALVARSISNLAFLNGEEQEALCYSYESLKQMTDGNGVANHALLLLGLNQTVGAHDFLLSQMNQTSVVKNSGFSQFVLALTKLSLGDVEGVRADSKLARQLSTGSVEYKDQLEALRFLLLETPLSDTEDSPDKLEEHERLRDLAKGFSVEGWYKLLFWPENVRELLLKSFSDVPTEERALDRKT